jgi:hypothetical protein
MMRRVVTLVMTVAALSAQAGEHPVAYVDAAGVVTISLDPRLLREAEAEKHLNSGLTTSFIVRADDHPGGVRVDIRYDLWDEVFQVQTFRGDGRNEKMTIRSRADLEAWWTSPRFQLTRGARAGDALRLTAMVLPFSASEEADAKRWLARSLGSTPPPAASEAFGPPSLFSAVIGSSVRRKPVVKLTWQSRITQRAP